MESKWHAHGLWHFWLWGGLFLLLASFIGIAVIVFSPAWKHKIAVEKIERTWGRVTYEPNSDNSMWRGFARKLLGDSFVSRVVCVRAGIGSHCTLEDLMALPEVQQLELSGANINANELVYLKSLPNLWILSLDGTNVTDDDLKEIKGLTRLMWLNLSCTQITDNGLEHLKLLHNLTLLRLRKTGITNHGEKMLRLALPRCEIFRTDADIKGVRTIFHGK